MFHQSNYKQHHKGCICNIELHCAPCSRSKGPLRDLFSYCELWEKHSITYDGLVALLVNCVEDVTPSFIEWEWH